MKTEHLQAGKVMNGDNNLTSRSTGGLLAGPTMYRAAVNTSRLEVD